MGKIHCPVCHSDLKKELSALSDADKKLALIILFCQNNYNTIHPDTFSFIKIGLKIAGDFGLKNDENILNTYYAFYLLHHEKRNKAIDVCNSILPGLLKKRNYSEFGLAIIILSQIEWAKGNLEKAYEVVGMGFDLLKNKKNKHHALIRLNWILGGFSLDLNEIELALHHYQISNKLCVDETDLGMISYVKIGLGSVYKNKKNYPPAYGLFKEALAASQKNKLWLVESRSYFELGSIEMAQKNYTKAHELLKNSYDIRKKNKAFPALVSSLNSLAELDLEMHNLKHAKSKLREAESICIDKNLRAKMSSVLLLMAKLAETTNDYKSALNYYKKHTQLEKEISKITIENRNQYLKLNYNAKKTKQENALQRLTNRKLKTALEKEKELNELKSRFVSVASHQFRTPMAIIQSNTDLVDLIVQKSDSQLSRPILKANGRIQREIQTMVGLMDEILVLGKITSGSTLILRPRNTNLEDLCHEVASAFNELQDESREAIIITSGRTKNVNIDRNLFKHILNNLLSNAFKYSSEIDPKIKIEYEEHTVKISIIDEGIGIPVKDLPNLFTPFHRATNVGDIKGTGLGLSIVKEYVELHGGTIDVQSNLNNGSCFIIDLPYVKE